MTQPTYDENGNLTGATKEMVEDTIIHNGVAYTMNSKRQKMLKQIGNGLEAIL